MKYFLEPIGVFYVSLTLSFEIGLLKLKTIISGLTRHLLHYARATVVNFINIKGSFISILNFVKLFHKLYLFHKLTGLAASGLFFCKWFSYKLSISLQMLAAGGRCKLFCCKYPFLLQVSYFAASDLLQEKELQVA